MGTPHLPQGIFSHHLGAVTVDSATAFFENARMPARPRLGIFQDIQLQRSRPQNIEVVNFSQQVLQLLEVVAPGLVLFR